MKKGSSKMLDKGRLYNELKKIYDAFRKPTKISAYIKSISALVSLAESRDPYAMRHSAKVTRYAVLFAKYLGFAKERIEVIKLSAMLHDVGKIGIREDILLKEGSLTESEYEEVKKHSPFGAEIVKPLRFLEKEIPIIRHHHENFDGTGYPDGLKGEEIPLEARILSLSDVYDALTSDRPYRKAYSPKKALEIMQKEVGKKFDPELFEKFKEFMSNGK